MAAVKEARKSAWAGKGSAAICTTTKYKCGSAHACTHMLIFQAHVHVHRRSWCPVPQPTVGGAGHSRHGQENHAADSLLKKKKTFCGISRRYECQSDSRRVFSHERRKTPIHLVSGFQFLAQLVARLVSSCGQSLDPKAGSIGGHTSWFHTRAEVEGVRSLTSLIIFWCQRSYGH